jgi:hypothetical protein
MELEFKAESIRAAPAVAGTVTSAVAGTAGHIDWAQMAGAATVFYIMLQCFYLLWKWNRERKLPPVITEK